MTLTLEEFEALEEILKAFVGDTLLEKLQNAGIVLGELAILATIVSTADNRCRTAIEKLLLTNVTLERTK